MKNKLIAFLCTIAMIVPTCSNVYASDYKDYYKILEENGCSTLILDELTCEELEELGEQALANPDTPVFETQYEEVDNLEELQNVASLSEDELEDAGVSEQTIESIEETVDTVENGSIEEIQEKFDVDEYSAELMKDSVKEEVNEKGNEDVQASGSISKSKLGVSIFMTADLSDSSSKSYKTKYRISTIWAWDSAPLVQCFDDFLAFSWGGNFVQSNGPTGANYNNVVYYKYLATASGIISNWNKTYTETSTKYLFWNEDVADAAGHYVIKPSTNNFWGGGNCRKSGRVCFYLSKKKKNTYGTSRSVLCNYVHNSLAVNSVSFSTNGASVTAGTGQYVSDSQGKTTICY